MTYHMITLHDIPSCSNAWKSGWVQNQEFLFFILAKNNPNRSWEQLIVLPDFSLAVRTCFVGDNNRRRVALQSQIEVLHLDWLQNGYIFQKRKRD